jgi:23S rRNA (uracil1939-C5)-methyltransferase
MSAHATRRCIHFGECGGCRSQDVPYDEQLAQKGQALAELFAPFWPHAIPVTPSPVLWNYRNKVDFTFARMQYPEPPPKDFVRDTVLGFNRRGRWYWPLDIEDCHIGPSHNAAILAAVREWMRRHELRAFDSRTGDGLLKVLLVREGKRTGQLMVVLITAPGAFDTGSFVEAVRGAAPVDSIQWAVHYGTSHVAFGEELQVLDGAPAIEERLHVPDGESERVLRFRISPWSFFQTNTFAAERLYGTIRHWLRDRAPRILYDLYGGAGGIAFACSDLVERVESVENVPDASEDGRDNARANGITNVNFLTEKVKNYLIGVLDGGGMGPDAAAIVDPPRSGLHPKALRRLLESAPRDILYVSCNPKILAQELPRFLEAYQLRDLRAIDMFPHTPHVEALAWMARNA